MRLSIFRKGLLLVLIPLLLQLLFIWRLRVLQDRSREAETWYAHTKDVLAQANLLYHDLIDAQNSIRGYAITEQDELALRFDRASDEAIEQLSHVRTLVADNPQQLQKLEQLAKPMREALNIFHEEKELVAAGNADAVLGLIRSLKGQTLVAEFSRLIKEFTEEEERMDARRHQALRDSRELSSRLLYWGCVGALVCSGLLLFAFGRSISRRIHLLATSMRSYVPGEAHVVPNVSGHDEITDLHATFREMLATIERAAGNERALLASLEKRVEERTSELQRANEDMQREVEKRQKAESDLQALATELKRSNRDLQDFAMVASHDLQEPLRKVRTFAERLVEDCAESLNAQGRSYLDRMVLSVARMQTLITDILAFSRITTKAAPFKMVDLAELVDDVIADLDGRITESKAELTVTALPPVYAEATHMQQLFQNLIGNALKFRGPDTRPLITVGQAQAHELREFGVDVGEGKVAIIVADNGIGFEQEYAERIFGIFQRLHGRTEYEGTGVGLALCRKIAEYHGGQIMAISKPGEGAKFLVLLPDLRKHKAAAA